MTYEKIQKVDLLQRPFWSVMIPVRNRVDFLAKAITSVLDNNIPESMMQIEVVDNSTNNNDIEKIVDKLGKGRVSYFKQSIEKNMAENWNTCLKRAIGQFIHILHDDDYIASTFYSEFHDFIKINHDYGLYWCNSIFIDSGGCYIDKHSTVEKRFDNMLEIENFYKKGKTLDCPGVVVKRDCYEQVGGFNNSLIYVLDQEMWARIIQKFKGISLNRDLSFYRTYNSNATHDILRAGANIEDIKKFMLILKENGMNFSKKNIQETAIYISFSQYQEFRNKGDIDAAKINHAIFIAHTKFLTRRYHILVFFLSKFHFKYYFLRFFYYFFHPWAIRGYRERRKYN